MDKPEVDSLKLAALLSLKYPGSGSFLLLVNQSFFISLKFFVLLIIVLCICIS